MTTPNTSRITKRKLDDAISILDSAVHDPNVTDSTYQKDTGPSPTKRATTAKSIYASLSKYGFRNKEKSAEKAGPSRTPMLTSLLHRSRSKSVSRPISHPPPIHPTISLPQPLSSRPPYRPTSTLDFLARLATFRLATYRDKPRGIDAVAASRCGWKNEGPDRLVCDNCSAAWVVGSTAGMNRDAASTLTERQRASMVTAHKESCPWRKRQCDESIYRVPLKGSTALAREVATRARAMTPHVQNVSIKHPLTPSQLTNLISMITSLPRTVMDVAQPSESGEISQTSLVLSLFGWEPWSMTISSNSVRKASYTQSLSRATSVTVSRGPSLVRVSNGVRHSVDNISTSGSIISPPSPNGSPTTPDDKDFTLSCPLCQRRLGLWAFRSSPNSSEDQHAVFNGHRGTNGDPAPGVPSSPPTRHASLSSHPRRPINPRPLDVVKEHRSFCPYVARSTPLPSFPSIVAKSSTAPGGVTTSAAGGSDETLVEGWRAVLSVVGRAGLGARRRRSDIFGPLSTTATVEEGQETADVDSMVESVKRGGSKELLRYVKGLLG